MENAAESVLYGDALQASVLPDEDARMEFRSQAAYQSARTLSETIPNLAADTLASAVLAIWVAFHEPAWLLGPILGVTFVAAPILVVSRRSVERSVERAWRLQLRVHETLTDALDGRLEVVASGLRSPLIERLRERTSAWAAAGAKVAIAAMFSGRIPLVAVAVIGAIFLFVGTGRSIHPVDGALLVSMTPAFAGVVQGLDGLVRDGPWVGVLARVKRAPRRNPARRAESVGILA